MKRIITLLALFCFITAGWAQVVTTWTTAGDPVTKDALVASAGTGAKYAFRMPSKSQPGWCGFRSTIGKATNLDVAHLFTLEKGSAEGKYWLKRFSNNEYLSGNNTFSTASGINLTLTNRVPTNVNDYDTGYSNSTPFVSFDNDGGSHYNNGEGNYDFRGGTGGWSVYVIYGPFYVVTVNYFDENNDPLQASENIIVKESTVIDAPTIAGRAVQGTNSVTVNADQTITFNYVKSSYDYKLVVNNAPAGTTMTIKGDPVALDAGNVSYPDAVTESDVVVTYPSEYSYMATIVTITGTTITVDCYDPRWPVNFDKSTVSTHASRYTDMVGLDDQTISWSSHAKDVIYRDLTDQTITVPAGKTVTPVIGYRGWAMYGYLYIDYNNDGDFTDEGELVSQLGGNNWTSGSTADKTIPAFTLTNTPGIYRARFKVEWNNADPGGNVPSMDENGGSITDVTLRIFATTEEQAAAFAKTQTWLAKTELVTDASNYVSNAKQSGEGTYEALLDNDYTTYFHSQWSGSMAGTSGHDLQVRLPEAIEDFYLYYVTRSTGTGYPQAMRIDGSNNAEDFTDDAAGGATWTNNVSSLSGLPAGATTVYLSDKITLTNAYKYLRFVPDVSYKDTHWFCLAEFHIFSADARAEAARTFLETMPAAAGLLTAEQIAQINTIDQGVTALYEEIQNAAAREALSQAIITANDLIACDGVPGYPTTEALNTLAAAVATAQVVLNNGGDYQQACNTLTAAIAAAEVPANINYIPHTDVYYTIVNSRGAMVYDPSHSGSVDTQNDNAEYIWYGSTTPDATNPNNLWGFIESDGHYYMYNVGKQQFASVGNGSYGSTWIFSNTPAYITLDDGIADEIVPPGVRVRATVATTGLSYTMSVSTSYTGPVITYDANGDGGVPMIFTESSYAMDANVTAAIEALIEDVTPYRNALKDVIDGCASISFGAGLNQYSSNSTYTDALTAANTAYNNASATKSELQDAKTDLETAIAGLSINLPSAGFYRIKGKTSGKYLASGFASNNKFAMTDNATDATTIFYYDGTKLTNLSSGMCNGVTTSAWAWVTGDVASTVTFEDGQSNGGYLFHSADAYLFDGGTSADRGNGYDSRPQYRNWYLEEVTTLPIALNAFGESYYSTFYSPVNVEVSGATAYTLTLKSNYLSATEISDGVIPANTGVVLVGTSAAASVAVTDATPSADSGVLTGTVAAATSSESDYIFTVVDNEIGFYKNGFGTVKGFKAFYRPSDSSVRGFAINFGLNDAITDILHQVSPKNVYDLQGRRVNEPAKGLYIINGKKVIK